MITSFSNLLGVAEEGPGTCDETLCDVHCSSLRLVENDMPDLFIESLNTARYFELSNLP